MAIKDFVPMATHSPPVLTHLISKDFQRDFQREICSTRSQTRANIFICLLDHAYDVMLGNMKMESQRWSEKLLIGGGLEPSLLPWQQNCSAHIVEHI